MTKFLCLIRHVDSEKNAHEIFDGLNTPQRLTLKGQAEVAKLIPYLETLIERNLTALPRLYSANSDRAIQTAQVLEEKLSLKCTPVADLGSMGSGPLAGLSETEAKLQFPEYMKTLELYRSGLLSSDKIARPEGCEALTSYEKRIATCLNRILQDGIGGAFVVGHRSPISAICVSLARRYMGYPEDFFGYIPIPTGSVTLFNFSEKTFEHVGVLPD